MGYNKGMKEANLNWYNSLNRSGLTPPGWVFAPIWTILYLMMFASLILIVKDGYISNKIPQLGLFFIQLGLNLLWPDLFFSRHLAGAALIDIILLWVAILFTIISFTKLSIVAAVLLVPYFLWVSFATYLNYKIFILN